VIAAGDSISTCFTNFYIILGAEINLVTFLLQVSYEVGFQILTAVSTDGCLLGCSAV
jgi:hypothetical protein